ncbi:MAG TPA: RNA pseudouridine synthase [Candidatus Udaeobacter sp.]|jgi:23S rRNA pseudouridine1911/1915/1917 synthase
MLVPHHSLHFNIVDETDEYVVVDKPPFLLIHPTKPNGAPTLWKELRELLAFEIASGGQVSIVNRLDRETSGLVLVAKTSPAARRFGLLMQRQQVKKEYLAIVWGWPEWERYLVDAPMDRQGKHQESAIWLKQMIHPSGAPAQTEFYVERRFVRSMVTPSPLASRLPLSGQGEDECEDQRKVHGKNSPHGEEKFAVIRAIPRTGRTHQIRVHLSAIGHPIVGDKIYGPNEQLYLRFVDAGWTLELEQRLLLPRHALHSAKLAIEGDQEWASPLPPDLAEFCSGDR